MKTEWDHMDIAPCILPSKDNAAALNAAAADQAVWGVTGHAIASSVGGAKKLTEPAEALLNHKDDKKGQHDNFRGYALVKLGHALTFPDTSSTRFGSYLHATAELISRLDFYIGFLEQVCYSKEKPGLNHMEENVRRALLDAPTQTELAVLALYLEAVSHPYFITVRGPGQEQSNALDTGPFHAEVDDHICKLIEDPALILLPGAEPEAATLAACKTWQCPDAMQVIRTMHKKKRLPFLERMFIAFLNGAKKLQNNFRLSLLRMGS